MKKLFLLSITFLFLIHLKAQTIGGGEIYYELLSYKKYKVTAHVYRECSGSALNNLSGYVLSDSFKLSMNFKRISIKRINDTCGNPCAYQNSASNKGYEKHTFIDTIDFNLSPYDKFVKAGNCKVYFAIQQNLRPSTTTLNNNSTNKMFYLDAMVDICLYIKKNRSPEFSIEPKLNTCCYQPFIYNMGYMDTTDFDSLGLELSAPLVDYKTAASYSGSFTQSIPATPYCPPNPGTINCRPLPNAKPPRGFYFDKETGDISFTPVKCDEVSAIKVIAREYRKDSTKKFVLIGYVSREMIMLVQTCPDNNPPYFTGSNKYTVCENNKICFTMGTKDDQFLPNQTKADTVTMFWDHGIPSATCTIVDSSAREKEMQFCWQTNPMRGGQYNRFTVAAFDKKCNIGLVSRGYLVNKKPNTKHVTSYTTKCNKLHYEISVIDSFNNSVKSLVYQVKVKPFTSPTNIIAQSNKRSDSLIINNPGKYYIETYINNPLYNCPVTNIDTVFIGSSYVNIAFNKDTLFCQNDSVILSTLNDSFKGYKIHWFDSDFGNTSVDSSNTYKFRLNGLKKLLRIQITDKNGCQFEDKVNVYSRGSFTILPSDKILNYCAKSRDTLKVANIKGKAPFTIAWYLNNQYVGNDSILPITLFANKQLKVSVADSFNCPSEDTAYISIQTPSINMQDTDVCLLDVVNIASKVKGSGTYSYQWTLDNVVSSQTGTKFNLKVMKDHLLNLKVTTSTGCSVNKTILVKALTLPRFKILGDTVYNKTNYIVLSTDSSFSTYQWSNGASTQTNSFWAYSLGSPGSYTIECTATNSYGCSAKEAIKFRTNGMTSINILSTKKIAVSPNPFTNHIEILSQKDGVYTIFDLNGKMVKTGTLKKGSQSILLEDLSDGEYIISDGTEYYKIIKTN